MWEKVSRSGARQKSEGADISVILHGPQKVPMLRIRIWPDVAEELGWDVDADVSLSVGRGKHDGLFRLSLDRLGDFVLRAPQGGAGCRQVLAKVGGYDSASEPVRAGWQIEADGMTLVLAMGLSSATVRQADVDPMEEAPRHAAADLAEPAPEPPPPPPPPAPAPEPAPERAPASDAGKALRSKDTNAPQWLKDALRERPTERVRDILQLLASGKAVTLSAVIYHFRPPIKEALADSVISEVRRVLERAGWRLVRKTNGEYVVGSKRDDD